MSSITWGKCDIVTIMWQYDSVWLCLWTCNHMTISIKGISREIFPYMVAGEVGWSPLTQWPLKQNALVFMIEYQFVIKTLQCTGTYWEHIYHILNFKVPSYTWSLVWSSHLFWFQCTCFLEQRVCCFLVCTIPSSSKSFLKSMSKKFKQSLSPQFGMRVREQIKWFTQHCNCHVQVLRLTITIKSLGQFPSKIMECSRLIRMGFRC
jgi:hypothetical protein